MIDRWINTVQKGNCIGLMHQLPPRSIDLITTDPPANEGPLWLGEAFRVLKSGRVCYVLSTEATMQRFKSFVDSSEFRLIMQIVWKHPDAPIYKWTPIFLLSRGEPRVELLPTSSEWNYAVVPLETRIIPAQKPIELIEYMILNSSHPGEIVLDPYLGVGSTAIACKRLNRHWIGMEILTDRCRISRDRLAQVIP